MKRILALTFLIAGTSIVLSILSPYFLTKANLLVLVDNMAMEIIVVSGMSFLLIAGLFDLSVDGVVALTGITAGMLMSQGIPWPLAMLAGMLVGLIAGTINGVIVLHLRINALIATMTMWWICAGITLGWTRAMSPYGFPEAFQALGQYRIGGLKILILYAIPVVAYMSFKLHRGVIGNHVYAMGGNQEAAILAGVNTKRLGIGLYILMGLFASFIGLIMVARLNTASLAIVDGMTLKLVAAAVIGGCSLEGGKGTVIGSILGLVFMSMLVNAIVLLGLSPYWQKSIVGGILLAAVLSEKVKIIRRNKNA